MARIPTGIRAGPAPGTYSVQIDVDGEGLDKGQSWDYAWNDGNRDNRTVKSDKFEFTVPGK